MSELSPLGERLDSWKAIAKYLQRDIATVARWEKLGLPVRRVAGSGRSVFAYTGDINQWLHTTQPVLAADATPATASVAVASRWPWLALTVATAAVAAGLIAIPTPITLGDLRVELSGTGLIAHNSAGAERWRYAFPAGYNTAVFSDAARVMAGARPGVYFATAYRRRHPEGEPIEGGVLSLADLKGNLQRSFSFDDQVKFQGTSYGPPWHVTAFDINDAAGARRVAVSAHHYVWDPGVVTILDDQWQRRGTFVHAGWIEGVRWLGHERLLISGFSNARDGGMVALLDPAALDGQGPETPGTRHVCETCGSDRPLRMFVFPRSEINLAAGARFNRVLVQQVDERLIAHTIEISSENGDADALYEFTPSLDLIRASFSERYWEMHRSLEMGGAITHTRAECPDRDGPRQIQKWEPGTGWRTVTIR